MNESKIKQCVKFRIDWAICFKRTKFGENKVFGFGFRDTKTKPKKHHCVFQLKDHQIVEAAGPKTKKSKKYTQKSDDHNH